MRVHWFCRLDALGQFDGFLRQMADKHMDYRPQLGVFLLAAIPNVLGLE